MISTCSKRAVENGDEVALAQEKDRATMSERKKRERENYLESAMKLTRLGNGKNRDRNWISTKPMSEVEANRQGRVYYSLTALNGKTHAKSVRETTEYR
jgi:hypothetical protein